MLVVVAKGVTAFDDTVVMDEALVVLVENAVMMVIEDVVVAVAAFKDAVVMVAKRVAVLSSFDHSFIHSFVRSFIRSFVCLLAFVHFVRDIKPITCLFRIPPSLSSLFIRLFVCSFVHLVLI